MPYLVLTDLPDRLPETLSDELVTDIDPATGNPTKNADLLTDAITHADDQINSYLSKRWQVPLANPSSIVKDWALDFAADFLFRRRPLVRKPPRWAEMMAELEAKLERVAESGIPSPLAVGTEPPPATSMPVATTIISQGQAQPDLRGLW